MVAWKTWNEDIVAAIISKSTVCVLFALRQISHALLT